MHLNSRSPNIVQCRLSRIKRMSGGRRRGENTSSTAKRMSLESLELSDVCNFYFTLIVCIITRQKTARAHTEDISDGERSRLIQMHSHSSPFFLPSVSCFTLLCLSPLFVAAVFIVIAQCTKWAGVKAQWIKQRRIYATGPFCNTFAMELSHFPSGYSYKMLNWPFASCIRCNYICIAE